MITKIVNKDAVVVNIVSQLAILKDALLNEIFEELHGEP